MNPWFKQRIIALSDKIVYASNAYVGVKSQLNSAAGELIDFSEDPSTDADIRARKAASLLRPFTAPNLELFRVGGDHDGGYVMADEWDVKGAISIGVGPDVSWDLDIAKRGIPVHMFDPTIKRTPAKVPGGTFHRIGIGAVKQPAQASFRPLADLVTIAGFTVSDQLLLKIDVEGAEWDSLPETNLRQFPQILLELHGLKDLHHSDHINTVLEHLHATHRPVHIHANNYDTLVNFGNYWLPNALEVTFVRTDKHQDWQPSVSLRTDLDRPNDPRAADISCAGFLSL